MHYTRHRVPKGGWTRWIWPKRKYKLQCCDCGLVHDLEFDVQRGHTIFRARRNNKQTKEQRALRNGPKRST